MSPLDEFKNLLRGPDVSGFARAGLIGDNARIRGPFGRRSLLYADYVASERAKAARMPGAQKGIGVVLTEAGSTAGINRIVGGWILPFLPREAKSLKCQIGFGSIFLLLSPMQKQIPSLR